MKILILLLVSTLSMPAFSRVYIQCADSNSWDRAVINLNQDQSTLFMTNGVHLPDEIRVLKDLNLIFESQTQLIYETSEGNIKDKVFIPLEQMQANPNYFTVKIEHTKTNSGYTQSRIMGCFSSVHNIEGEL
jgi:hypothetical protein